jgi:hypothetical protein
MAERMYARAGQQHAEARATGTYGPGGASEDDVIDAHYEDVRH